MSSSDSEVEIVEGKHVEEGVEEEIARLRAENDGLRALLGQEQQPAAAAPPPPAVEDTDDGEEVRHGAKRLPQLL